MEHEVLRTLEKFTAPQTLVLTISQTTPLLAMGKQSTRSLKDFLAPITFN
jgi:hypothetical protein